MADFFHSVRLDEERCMGCTNCIKRCPTGAIRVRNGKAHIIKERCIDCGECIKICPHHAKYADCESLNRIVDYKYRVALPAPTLYGQFNNLEDVNYVLTGLKMLGFDDVFEVAVAAELVSQATDEMLANGELKKPAISSACPAICRLIRMRYPNLIPNMVNLNSPMEVAGKLAREKAVKETGLKPEEIGVFFITPCPAKITAIKQPIFLKKSNIDGAVAIKDIYPALVKVMDGIVNAEPLNKSGFVGVGWASSGGESSALLGDKYLAADGIENVIKVLEEIEDEKLNNIDFIELNACAGGCVGGSLTAENAYVAKSRIQHLRKGLPVSQNHLEGDKMPEYMKWQKPLVGMNIMSLSDDMVEAMQKMKRLKEIEGRLPGLDCGTCGAPSCHDLAEDIVRGFACETDCVFLLRDELDMHENFKGLIPAPFRKPLDNKKKKAK
ncbi:MAG TPA: [Fe-Fe] hydrogenase large subunit C-terminal domain-containing protein [Clostridia bacterium]|nr:[Fe-Fe] hydrogenase large subunit C-terminal domain-containing protein [Clostridia bacterium]